jgi:ABC-type sugar transport system ATPase subunit
MIHVTHDQAEALTLGDRVAVLRVGRLEQVGTAQELWEQPTNRFVARFVGSPGMNIVPADGPFRIEGVAGPGLELGVRPEHVSLVDVGAEGIVTLVESVGEGALVRVATSGVEVVVRVEGDLRPTPGDIVRLAAPRSRIHVFDAGSGRRLGSA